eukprot:TRINITY_DN10399_c0_g1_i13.p1 TRINITY_DN10399_c0_g1~~TRINITY_DN10399_c0_g1_i13.p1  ORF type:complete len:139 (-),score=33.01 TRINITY_DN10399_c0_g1_i13:22-438(-)
MSDVVVLKRSEYQALETRAAEAEKLITALSSRLAAIESLLQGEGGKKAKKKGEVIEETKKEEKKEEKFEKDHQHYEDCPNNTEEGEKWKNQECGCGTKARDHLVWLKQLSAASFAKKEEIGRAVQQECRDRSRMPSSA